MTVVVAHRGDSAEFPENTLPAFESAVGMGVDMVELDFHATRDGELVCLHDATLDRTTDSVARWGQLDVAVADRDLDRIRELDAGTWKSARFAGTRVPTVGEALDAILPNASAFLEHKAGPARTLVDLLRERELTTTVWVMSFDWNWLAEVHALEPVIRLAALGGDDATPTLEPEHFRRIAELGADIVNWNGRLLRARDVEAIHAAGWLSSIYTADEVDEFEHLVSIGVDVITTNRPGRLLEFLG